jgi:hypothetical protein
MEPASALTCRGGGSTTTSLGAGPSTFAPPPYQLDGAPAALQIVAHKPCPLKSPLADGSQIKPIRIAITAIVTMPPTLVTNHGLRTLKTRS